MEREVSRILDRLTSDLLVILVVEGQNATEEQVGDHTQGPVVDLLAVGLLQEDLRSDV